MTTTTFTIQ